MQSKVTWSLMTVDLDGNMSISHGHPGENKWAAENIMWRVFGAILPGGRYESPGEKARKYLDRTQAWRPLDIHPDWAVWPGAISKKSKRKGK